MHGNFSTKIGIFMAIVGLVNPKPWQSPACDDDICYFQYSIPVPIKHIHSSSPIAVSCVDLKNPTSRESQKMDMRLP
eukprot:scaffold471373_cov20-Prasinocladus_malaysianus.AAC.1